MSEASIFSIRHWTLPQLMLVGSGCFALAAIAFFVAAWLQINGPETTLNDSVVKAPSMSDRQRVIESDTKKSINSQSSVGNVNPAQADEADPNAAAKLKIIQ